MATALIDLPRDDHAAPGCRRGDDFPAWLPPMVVKELRQGIQTGVFAWTFVCLHAAMAVLFFWHVSWLNWLEKTNLLSDPRLFRMAGNPRFSAIFWFVSVVTIAVVLPLRGLGGIAGERGGNALDLLQITRLSATRIVLGKWASLMVQVGLVAVSILPYLVLRYGFGGIDVLGDLVGLGWVVAVAALVAAAALAISTLPMWLRIGLGTLVVAWFGYLAIGVFQEFGHLSFSFAGLGAGGRLGILAGMIVYTLAFLEFAAARIAPSAENHAARKRLIAVLLAALWPAVGWLATEHVAWAIFAVTAPLLLCYAIGATVERPSRVRTLFGRFRRAGILGRVAATVFAPGWATGLVFLAVVLVACAAGWIGIVARFVPPMQRGEFLAFASLVAAAIVFPLPFTALAPQARYPLLLYGLVQIVCFCSFAFANACKPFGLKWSEYELGRIVTLPFPAGAIGALMANESSFDEFAFRFFAFRFMVAGLAVIGVVLAVMLRPWLRELAMAGLLVRGEGPVALPRVTRAAGRQRKAAVRQPEATVRPWVWQGDDFSDRLPAMVVRELRQGVQSGVFAYTFIGIQAVMFALTSYALGTFGGAPSGVYARDFNGLFWLGIAAALVLAIPLRGLTALSGEQVGNNLDLVRLTRLSATQIVFGKWLAIIGQGLLVAIALAPHLVLRYFLGSVDVVVDLEILGWLAAAAMVVAAAALAISTLPMWLRIGLGIGTLVVAWFGFLASNFFQRFGGSWFSFAGLGAGGRLGILAGLAMYAVALLECAAARIAPPAENHAARKRLLAVAMAIAWLVAASWRDPWVGVATALVTLPLLLCYGIGALLEKPVLIRSLYRPFARFGGLGRVAATVFSPGWATGVPFVAMTAGLCFLGCAVFLWVHLWSTPYFDDTVWAWLAVGCLVVPAVFFPLPFLVWLPRARPRLLVYVLVQIVSILVFLAINASLHAPQSTRLISLPFPLAALLVFIKDMPTDFPIFMTAGAVTTLAVLGLVAVPWWNAMRQVTQLVTGKPDS